MDENFKQHLLELAENFVGSETNLETPPKRPKTVFREDLLQKVKYVDKAEPPETIKEWREQMKNNEIKAGINQEVDNLTYHVSGRGRGIKDRIIKPGGMIEYHPTDDEDLRKKIREVSGLGYSNELIEQSYQAIFDTDLPESTLGLKFVSTSDTDNPSNTASSSR